MWSVAEQALYWVDILGKQLHRHHPASGQDMTWTFAEEISAVAPRSGGPGLVIALRRGWALFDPQQPHRNPALLAEPEPDQPGNRFNDGKCDAQGRFWAGTMDFDCTAPSGSLYSLSPRREVIRHDSGFPVTNGPTWSRDGRTLYFNDTDRRRTFAYDFDPESGRLSGRRLWLAHPHADGYPDGMTTDDDGRIWIAHWAGACVTCHDPVTAAELGRLEMPVSQVTNCAFGGPELRTLYITSARNGLSDAQIAREPLAGGLFKVELPVSGLAPHPFRG